MIKKIILVIQSEDKFWLSNQSVSTVVYDFGEAGYVEWIIMISLVITSKAAGVVQFSGIFV